MSVILATVQCNMMEQQALLDGLDVDQDAPTVCQMTDVEIMQMVQQGKIRIMKISVTMKKMRRVFKKECLFTIAFS
jgi:hypothetical protein